MEDGSEKKQNSQIKKERDPRSPRRRLLGLVSPKRRRLQTQMRIHQWFVKGEGIKVEPKVEPKAEIKPEEIKREDIRLRTLGGGAEKAQKEKRRSGGNC